jgi:hypothetical protein
MYRYLKEEPVKTGQGVKPMSQLRLCLATAAVAVAASTFAQTMPTAQPKFIHVYRESLKPGRAADHAKWEAGWPVAFEKAGAKTVYLALSTLTGPQEVWFIAPFASQAAFGESLAAESSPALAPELERLSKGDGEFLSEVSAFEAMARPELSQGQFPDMSGVRFYEVMSLRVKIGYEGEWNAAMEAYKAAAAKASPDASWRTYQAVAGAPGGTYFIMSSHSSFADFDKLEARNPGIWQAIPAEQLSAMGKFFKEGVVSIVTQRFKVEPSMSYVDAATKAKDPAFWGAKK